MTSNLTSDSQTMPEGEREEPFPEWVTFVGVKVRDFGEIKKVRTTDSTLRVGDHVMLMLDDDLTYGTVCTEPQCLPFSPPMRVMRSVLRKATDQDESSIIWHQKITKEALQYCRERAKAIGLTMKLVEVSASFQRRVLTFGYTAEERVDFRQLVKDLARRFSCRIEMRQISTREEASRLSGVDSCGLVLCCATFLTDFKPVDLKLRRGERASESDSHRIGVCGRLKCCLMFEQDDEELSPSASQALINPIRS